MSIRSMLMMSAVTIATLTTPPSFAAIGRSASGSPADGAGVQLPCGKMANAPSFADALASGGQRSQLAAVRPAANSGAPVAR